MDSFNEMIKKIGEELNIKVTLLSDNWTKVLEKDDEIHYITGYQFDLNGHGISNIMDDKGLFYDMLKFKNIPIIEQYVIFNNYDKNKAIEYLKKHNNEIIVKANISNAGKEVFKVDNEIDLIKTIDKLFLKHYSISLCPFYKIKNEYRVIILNGTIRLIFGKEKPTIIGDGLHSIKELANDYNYLNELENINYIPKKCEIVELSYKFNLSRGAKSFTNINEELKDKISNLALKVTKELGITFASVDIIDTDNNLLVLEANSGVTLNHFITQNNSYDLVYNIYRDAIKLMFKR